MKRISWDIIKEFYKSEFGINGWVVELFANQDILTLCASGASNETISKFTELPQDEIKEIINNSFRFDGWSEDLPINPYGYYSNLMNEFQKVNMQEFMDDLKEGINIDLDYRLIYFICKTMWEIESKINDEWI